MIKKLLKVLLIWWLFIPCFSNATYSPHTIGAYFGSEYQVSVWPQWILSTVYWVDEKSVFSPIWNLIFYWDNDKKPHLTTPWFFDLPGDMWNYNFYRLCDEIPDSNFTNITNCSDRVEYNDSFVSSFLSTISSNDNWAFELINSQNTYYQFNICFSSKFYHQSLCFFYTANQWQNAWWYAGDEFTCTSSECWTNPRYDFSSIPLEIIWTSPWVGWSKPSYEIWEDKYTYWQIVEWYEACWLDVWYCYWWFPIDDIFEPNQSIEDFTWYKFWYGANIRYLYSLYSGAYTPKEFFQQMLQAYNNWQINRFKTEPKALIMFVQQYVSWKSRGFLNVWFYDLWDYCNIKLWYNDLSAEYTWNNQTPVACYKNKITNEIPQWWFKFTWDNAYTSIVGTWWSWYSNASEFFWNISSMFQNWIWTVNTNYSWIIPAYILLFMFALILLRIIQH